MNPLYSVARSKFDQGREQIVSIQTESTFRKDGKIRPPEFQVAGDHLTKNCTFWEWHDADTESLRSPAMKQRTKKNPVDVTKQYLVQRSVLCYHRLGDHLAQGARDDHEELIKDGFQKEKSRAILVGEGDAGDDDGWLRTGGSQERGSGSRKGGDVQDVRTMDDKGDVEDGKVVEDDFVPDMEDDEDDEEAIVKEKEVRSDVDK